MVLEVGAVTGYRTLALLDAIRYEPIHGSNEPARVLGLDAARKLVEGAETDSAAALVKGEAGSDGHK